MTGRLIVFALWCAILLGAALLTAFNAYSFYSDDEGRPTATGQAGPTHK